jgi:hypothetical protein
MLIQYAGDVIPALGSVIGGKDFAPYFKEYLPEILKRLVSAVFLWGCKFPPTLHYIILSTEPIMSEIEAQFF